MACIGGFDTETGQPCTDAPKIDTSPSITTDWTTGRKGVYDATGKFIPLLDADGNYIYDKGSSGGGGTSSSFNVSELGPEAVRLREADQAQQLLVQQRTLEQQAQLAAQENQFAWSTLLNQIKATDATISYNQANLQFLRDKMAIEQQAQNATAARETAALIEQITLRMETTMTQRAGLTQQAQMLQAQMQMQAASENARNQMQADQINEARRQFNLEQRRGVAGDIANFAKDPGDVGANAAYLLAGGAAPISQALAAGKDARTQQSLLPLGLLLNTQDELNRGPAFLNAPTVNAPNVPLPSFGAITPPTAASLGLAPGAMPGGLPLVPATPPPVKAAPVPTAPPVSGQAAPNYLSPAGDPYSPEAQARWQQGLAEDSIDIVTREEDIAQHQADLAATGFDPTSWEAVAAEYEARGYDIPGFARGTPGSNAPISIVGEAGPELQINHAAIPGGPDKGFSIVPNHALPPEMGGNPFLQSVRNNSQGQSATNAAPMMPQAPQMPMQANPMALAMMQRGFLNALPQQAAPQAQQQMMQRQGGPRQRGKPQQIPAFAEGTPDWQALMGNVQLAAPFDRSLGFLNSAFDQALGQSPWAQSGVPTPVALSSPGTNPFLQEYAAALAATGSGIKPGLFQYEINQWRPQALSGQTVTRRTR